MQGKRILQLWLISYMTIIWKFRVIIMVYQLKGLYINGLVWFYILEKENKCTRIGKIMFFFMKIHCFWHVFKSGKREGVNNIRERNSSRGNKTFSFLNIVFYKLLKSLISKVDSHYQPNCWLLIVVVKLNSSKHFPRNSSNFHIGNHVS